MVLLLVASTSIPSLWRMYCPEMDRTTMAWVSIESCCAHDEGEHEGPLVKEHCCAYSMVEADLSDLQLLIQWVPIVLPEFTHMGVMGSDHRLELGQPLPRLAKPPPKGSTLDAMARLSIFRL